jgi:hypothetical protein
MKNAPILFLSCSRYARLLIASLSLAILPITAASQIHITTNDHRPLRQMPIPAVSDSTVQDTVILEEPAEEAPAAQPVEETMPEPEVRHEEEPEKSVAHCVGIGFSSSEFLKTIKHDGDSLNTSETMSGYGGIFFQYRLIRPSKKIYFSPNLVYSYQKKKVRISGVRMDSFIRYFLIAGNVGLNFNQLLEKPLIVETFLEGGLGIVALEEGLRQSSSNWHMLLFAMDFLVGGRYWVSGDFGLEATFRYTNCFLDSGLDSENTDEYFTFNSYMFGIGIVVRP